MTTQPTPLTPAPSALRRQQEQEEREERILQSLAHLRAGCDYRLSEGVIPEQLSAPGLIWDLQAAIGTLHEQGLLRRDADIRCLQRVIADLAGDVAKVQTLEREAALQSEQG